MSSAHIDQTATAVGQVAPLLPPTADPPLPACCVGFVRGLLLFWLLPRRYGPHLAAGSLRRALTAHGLAMLLTAAVAGSAAVISVGLPRHADWYQLRVSCAEWVLQQAALSTANSVNWLPVALVAGGIPLLELGSICLAILLMPWCADGDSARSVFKRSLKNVYWTTTAVFPLASAWIGFVALMDAHPDWLRSRFDVLGLALLLLGMGGSLALTVRMLLVGASRYVGEPDGPGFRPREPHCDDCGYLIVGLPLTANCPECGLPVKESLPGGRRRPTDFQKSELSPRGFLDLLRTQRLVLADPSFFKRLPVQQELRTARHFWWGTFMLIVLVSLAYVRMVLFLGDDGRFIGFYLVFTIVMLLLPIVAQLLMMFAACLWSQVAYGIRDYRVAATTCYYASPLMWPWVFVLLVVTVLFAFAEPWFWYDRSIPILQFQFTRAEVLLLCWAILQLASVVFWWRRLLQALRDVRYANV